MPYTRAQLRDLARRRLGDLTPPYQWSDLQLNQWLNDAIADFSVYMPRLLEVTFDTVPGQQEYTLDGDVRRLVKVEYPSGAGGGLGENVLRPADSRQVAFLYRVGFYDYEDGLQRLYLSGHVPGGECRCTYLTDHAYLADDSDECSLPERQFEALLLYVRWAANQELASQESANPDPSSLAMGTLELNASRAERAYHKTIEEYLRAEARSAWVRWEG
jgi:hypothetical protein